jgi:plastocyanin
VVLSHDPREAMDDPREARVGLSRGRSGRRRPLSRPSLFLPVLARVLLVAPLFFAPAFSPAQEARAPGGTIRGRVEVRREPGAGEGRPAVADLGHHAPRDAPDRKKSVVYLETAPQPAFEAPVPGRAVLDQRNETFVPHVLAVTVGSTVDFPNSDRVYHNVFSLSKVKRFDLGRYPRGQSRSVRFEQPGVVRVFCEIHSHMSAFILVFAHRYFATTDADGRYRIDGVPPGTYTLAVWNDGAVRDRKEVRVGAAGEAIEQDFVVE